ncbi:hypothetical protein IPH92_01810 [Candidatus Kaiserbacteria bacterium]|nr:MAG: hypothetical protein IPH92_01810 [Candidatus Kaiserbacteria bacterium]
MSSKIVHALSHGQPLCGFSTDAPAFWPAGHVWTRVSDRENINCSGCKQIIDEMSRQAESATSTTG